MRSTTVILILMMLSIKFQLAIAQSSNYTIESFQSEYIELSSYESVALLTQGDPLWEVEFPLNFEFPYYDSLYNRVIFNKESWGSFTDDQDEALYLMYFSRAYTYKDFTDTSNITSDVRFSHVEVNDMQAFVLQFTDNVFFADPYEGILDTYMNWQIWMYENGVLEVHIGEMHMDNTPIYVQGKGFYCYTNPGGIDTNEICGPYMGISNPLDEEDAISLSGSYDDFEIVGQLYSIMTELPPVGWVIRFKPMKVAIYNVPNTEQILINPNPTSTYINLPESKGRVELINALGELVSTYTNNPGLIDVANLPAGQYHVRIISKEAIQTGMFIRQ